MIVVRNAIVFVVAMVAAVYVPRLWLPTPAEAAEAALPHWQIMYLKSADWPWDKPCDLPPGWEPWKVKGNTLIVKRLKPR